MKVQMNPTTKQKFVHLPSQLCKSFNIKQGTDVEFIVEGKDKLFLLIKQDGAG